MSTNVMDHLALLERYRDIGREAERMRPVRRMRGGGQESARFYVRARTWLGRRLVSWGSRLQTVATGPEIRTAESCR